MSLDKNLTNRIFRIAIQAESAVIILINQQASAFGTDVSGQFFASLIEKPVRFHPRLRTRVLASFSKYWQVLANSGCTRRFTDSFTDSDHSARRNSLMHTHQNLEARVGIERGSFTVPSLTHSVSRLTLLILQGFQLVFSPPVQCPLIAPLLPFQCPSGEDLGETLVRYGPSTAR